MKIERATNYDEVVQRYIKYGRPIARGELDWFRQLPTLEIAIEQAALARNSKGHRHSHQRRFRQVTLDEAKRVLLSNQTEIEKARSFDELYILLKSLLDPIWGIGELYFYDTSLNIGAKLGKLPTRVYLHADTRKGARAIGLDVKKDSIEMDELPLEIQRLEPYEAEDVLCIYEEDLRRIFNNTAGGRAIKTRGCG